MSATDNFVYDSEGNLTYDKSKSLKILYDWRGMPIEFTQTQQPTGSSSNTLFKLLMRYDGSGRRISKTVMHKAAGDADWDKMQVTHYTGIGTEVREDFSKNQTKVVVNMPQGLGRYGIEDASSIDYGGRTGDQLAGYISNAKFEWYLKNHLGSTMLVYGTQADANPAHSDIGTPLAAYDYRAFGEMIELTPPPTGKVTENFTGKEHDDEIALDYFGARYLDPMLGMWISVDPARQFASPYLYAGNGMNTVNGVDPDGNAAYINKIGNNVIATVPVTFWGPAATAKNIANVKAMVQKHFSGKFGSRNVTTRVVEYEENKHGELNNYVLIEENIYSYVDARTLPENAYININSKRNTLHEFGHLLGLGDRYHHKQDDPQWGVPYKGYKHNLMGGEAGEINLDPSQIEEMWSPDYNYTEDNVESQNLYQYNVIFEE